MSNGAYGHHRLGQGNLENFNETHRIEIIITPEIRNNKLSFKYDITKIDLSDDRSDQIPEFCIDHDLIVKIVLDNNIRWRWSSRYDAITTKKELSYFYGNIKHIKSTPGGFYDTVTFEARKNIYGQEGTVHQMNLNVELLQDTTPPSWLQITIDPDVPNPPTPPKVAFNTPNKVLLSNIIDYIAAGN